MRQIIYAHRTTGKQPQSSGIACPQPAQRQTTGGQRAHGNCLKSGWLATASQRKVYAMLFPCFLGSRAHLCLCGTQQAHKHTQTAPTSILRLTKKPNSQFLRIRLEYECAARRKRARPSVCVRSIEKCFHTSTQTTRTTTTTPVNMSLLHGAHVSCCIICVIYEWKLAAPFWQSVCGAHKCH